MLTSAHPRAWMRARGFCPTMSLMQGTGQLIVMRHAKAGELPGGPDFERALKARGRSDSAAAGQWLRAGGYQPDVVLCSAARRTRQTWQYVSEVLGGTPSVTIERRLYGATADDVIDVIRVAGGQAGTLMYIGHNPAAVEVVAALTGTEPRFPTAAIAVIGVRSTWQELAARDGAVLASWTPTRG
jgi:phosphohistidine phosphatase